MIMTVIWRYSLIVAATSLLLAITIAGRSEEVSPTTGVVTANKLNVRAKPGVKYEIVSFLVKGGIVNVVERSGEWYGIRAPDQTEAWVAANQIDDGVVTEERAPVYSGPGTLFSVYAYCDAGDRVTVLNSRDEKWTRIEPPSDALVWVHGAYLMVAAEAESDTTPATLPTVVTDDSDIAAREESDDAEGIDDADKTADASANEDAVRIHPISIRPLEYKVNYLGDKKSIAKTGTVIPLDGKHFPFKYALAVDIDSQYYPMAYLNVEYDVIEEWVWKKVSLVGTQRWARGWPRPLIEIDTLELAGN